MKERKKGLVACDVNMLHALICKHNALTLKEKDSCNGLI